MRRVSRSIARLAVVAAVSLASACAVSDGTRLRGPVTTPTSVAGPYRRGSIGPLDPRWQALTVEALVQPWHVAVLGGYPRLALAAFGAGQISMDGEGGTFCPIGGGLGEGDIFQANDKPPPALGSRLTVQESLSPEGAAYTARYVGPGRALANGWTEYPSRTSPNVALFARPGRPWVCAGSAAIRDRVRASLPFDDRVPLLAGIPRDVGLYSVQMPCGTEPCAVEISLLQFDEDARIRQERFGLTHKLPAVMMGRRSHRIYPTPALAAAAEKTEAVYARMGKEPCAAPLLRGTELFLLSCIEQGPALIP